MWMYKSNIYENVAYNSTTASKSPSFLLSLRFLSLVILSALISAQFANNIHIYAYSYDSLILI